MEYIRCFEINHTPKSGFEPNALSMVFLVWQWERLYLSSLWVDRVLNGVMRKSFKGYPESLNRPPPSGRLAITPGMFEYGVTYASCVLPGNRESMLRNLKQDYSIVWSYKKEKRIVLYFKMNYICKWIALYKFANDIWTNSTLRPQPLVYSGHGSSFLMHKWAPHRLLFRW